MQPKAWKHLFTPSPRRCGQHIHSRSCSLVPNNILGGTPHLHAWYFSDYRDVCVGYWLHKPASPGSGLVGTHTVGFCGRSSSEGSREGQPTGLVAVVVVLIYLCGFLNWSPQGKGPYHSWDSPGPEWRTTNSFSACMCCSPHISHLMETPPSFRTLERTGTCSRALSCHLHPCYHSGLNGKRRCFFVSLFTETVCSVAQTSYCVSPNSDFRLKGGRAEQKEWHRGSRGESTLQECSSQRGPCHPAASHLPFSFSLSRTHKEVNIWFKIKQSNLKHTLCRQTSFQCKQSIKLKRSICTRYQLLHFFKKGNLIHLK